MNLLLVNDDGIHSQALRQLALALAKQHRVTVVAPDREQSAVSHGINLWDPLFVKEVPLGEGIRAYSVTGKPADCTRLGLKNLTQGETCCTPAPCPRRWKQPCFTRKPLPCPRPERRTWKR